MFEENTLHSFIILYEIAESVIRVLVKEANWKKNPITIFNAIKHYNSYSFICYRLYLNFVSALSADLIMT